MAGAGISGKYGNCMIASTGLVEFMKWSYTPKAAIYKYASNKTNDGGSPARVFKQAVAGVFDSSGTVEGAWDPNNPIIGQIDIGLSVTLKLYLDAASFYSVPCLIEDVGVEVDLDTGDIIKWKATFQGSGAYTNPIAGLTMTPPLDEPLMTPGPQSEVVPAERRTTTVSLGTKEVAELVAQQLTMVKAEMRTEFLQAIRTIMAETAIQEIPEEEAVAAQAV